MSRPFMGQRLEIVAAASARRLRPWPPGAVLRGLRVCISAFRYCGDMLTRYLKIACVQPKAKGFQNLRVRSNGYRAQCHRGGGATATEYRATGQHHAQPRKGTAGARLVGLPRPGCVNGAQNSLVIKQVAKRSLRVPWTDRSRLQLRPAVAPGTPALSPKATPAAAGAPGRKHAAGGTTITSSNSPIPAVRERAKHEIYRPRSQVERETPLQRKHPLVSVPVLPETRDEPSGR